MANTYTQIHIQIVFAVKYRQNMIDPVWKEDLYKYMTGIIQNHGHKVIIINGMPDHVHCLIGFRPVQALSELVKFLKQDSSRWINDNRLTICRFRWQEGFGAFSYSKSHLQRVIKYIQNQEHHHRRSSFREEYLNMLKSNEINYDERYLFKDPE